jgi:hypothetical protein
LFTWEVLCHLWIDWMHKLLWWHVFVGNRGIELLDMHQLWRGVLLGECGECVHCMSVGTVVIFRIKFMHGKHR